MSIICRRQREEAEKDDISDEVRIAQKNEISEEVTKPKKNEITQELVRNSAANITVSRNLLGKIEK